MSSSRDDAEAVRHLVVRLGEGGHRVRHDESLMGGQHGRESILAHIRDCDVFVVAVSRSSMNSVACRRELDYAVALGKTLLPVRVPGAIDPRSLTRPLAEIQMVDFLEPGRDLMRVVGANNLSSPSPPPTSSWQPCSRASGSVCAHRTGTSRSVA